jgi:hypothetical protein
MLLVMEKDVTLDPVDVGLLSSDAVNASSGARLELGRGVWACAGFYHRTRPYPALLRMNTGWAALLRDLLLTLQLGVYILLPLYDSHEAGLRTVTLNYPASLRQLNNYTEE